MRIENVTSTFNYGVENKVNKTKTFKEEFASRCPASIKQVDEIQSGGEFLGLTMVPEEGNGMVYGMAATLSAKSTRDNPVVQISSNLNGENKFYTVEINKIDPKHATQMEMFALCSYADHIDEGTGSTFGSYHTLRMLQDTAETNGITPTVSDGTSAYDNFMNTKKDWVNMCKQACDLLRDITDMSIRDLFLKGKRLTEFLDK